MSQSLPLDAEAARDAWLTRDVWPRRIFAFLVDLVLLAVLSVAVWWTIVVLGVATLGLGFLLLHFTWAIPPLYYVLWLRSAAAATPGQRLLGLTLRQDDTLEGGTPLPPSFAQALAWTVLLGVSFMVGMLPFLLVLVTRRRRAGHDLLSGLTVVHAAALGRPLPP